MDMIHSKKRAALPSLLLLSCLALLWAGFMPAKALAGPVFDRIAVKQILRCGVSEGLPGLALKDESGHWSGIEIDFCRAVAAAMGEKVEVQFLPLTPSARFPALKTGEIDLLLGSSTWTIGREAVLGLNFTGILYHDGLAFLVPRASGVSSANQLAGATLCVGKDTTHAASLREDPTLKPLAKNVLVLPTLSELKRAFFSGKCQAVAEDAVRLAGIGTMAPGGAEAYTVLPERFSPEPIGPVVNAGDEEWTRLVKWVLFALIKAEEHGVTQANAHDLRETPGKFSIQQLLDRAGSFGKALGTDDKWALRVVEVAGNYGEMFERNLGQGGPLKLARGLDRLWTAGGLQYAPPFR
jgi:general L-amino acid transport system substrate-binding protein